MFKQPTEILEADRRFHNMVGGLNVDGSVRLMAIDDLYELVQPLQLHSEIPLEIQEQFDKARNAFIYSWFAYDLATLAEQQAYQVLEMALREKLPEDEKIKASEKNWGLGKLLERAVAHKWITRKDFEVPASHIQSGTICLLDVLPRLRNELAHGSARLFPWGSLDMMGFCAEIINRLFDREGAASSFNG